MYQHAISVPQPYYDIRPHLLSRAFVNKSATSIGAAKYEPNAICKSNSLDTVALTHITNTANKNVCDCTVTYCHMTECVLQFSILAFIQYCTVTKIHCQYKNEDHGQWIICKADNCHTVRSFCAQLKKILKVLVSHKPSFLSQIQVIQPSLHHKTAQSSHI